MMNIKRCKAFILNDFFDFYQGQQGLKRQEPDRISIPGYRI
jgi:hypothetical protein